MDKYSYPIKVLTSEKNKLECVADNKPIGDSIGTLMGYIDDLQQAIDILSGDTEIVAEGELVPTEEDPEEYNYAGSRKFQDIAYCIGSNVLDKYIGKNISISISINKIKG